MSSNGALAEASSLVFAARSSLVREEVWLELTQVAFAIALDGFTRVRKVSAEGRAAMVKDVAALEEGLSAVHLCRAPRGREYVSALISAGALGDEEVLSWMKNNFASYAYRHLNGLATQVFSSLMSLNSARLKNAVALLDDLYEYDRAADGKTTTLSQLIQGGKGLLLSATSEHSSGGGNLKFGSSRL